MSALTDGTKFNSNSTYFVSSTGSSISGVLSLNGQSGVLNLTSPDSSITVVGSPATVSLSTTGNPLAPSTVAATGAISGASVSATGAVSGASVSATGAVSGATVAGTTSLTTPTLIISRPISGYVNANAIPLVLAGVAQANVNGFIPLGNNNIGNNSTYTTIFSWRWDTFASAQYANANLVQFTISGSASNPYGNTAAQSTGAGAGILNVVVADQTTNLNNTINTCSSLSGIFQNTILGGDSQNFSFPDYGNAISSNPITIACPKISSVMYFRGRSDHAIVFNTSNTNLYLHVVAVC